MQWVEAEDPQGHAFYYNPVTRQTSRAKPPPRPHCPPSGDPSAAHLDWVRAVVTTLNWHPEDIQEAIGRLGDSCCYYLNRNWGFDPLAYTDRDLPSLCCGIVRGLVSRADLNGRLCRVRRFKKDRQRWEASILSHEDIHAFLFAESSIDYALWGSEGEVLLRGENLAHFRLCQLSDDFSPV